MKPSKIVFITDGIEGGGAETIAVALAKIINPERYNKTLVVTRKCNEDLLRNLPEFGVKVEVIGRRSKWDVSSYAKLSTALKGADIIHAHKHAGMIHGRVWSPIHSHAKYIGHVHSRLTTLTPSQYFTAKQICSIYNRILLVSNSDYEEHVRYWGSIQSKFRVVHNGIDPSLYRTVDKRCARQVLDIQDDTFTIGCVGSINRYKGYQYLIESVAQLRAVTDRKIQVVIAGRISDSSLYDEMQLSVAKHNLRDVIRFLGHRHDIPQILCALDAFVMPSVTECFPVALLEAMASNLPIVATTVGGIPETLGADAGILVPSHSSRQLTQGILEILENPCRSQKMADSAYNRVHSSYSLRVMSRQIEDIYEQLLA
jgi:glycosyltransferase involved in cell wall biosynthesis